MITAQFLITSLAVVVMPGTGVVFTVSTGLGQGRRASVFAALGCTAGILPHLLASVLGLAALMHASAVAFQILKYAGAAYLLYIAYTTWKDNSTLAVEAVPSRSTALRLVVKAVLLNVLNQKLTLFFLAFLPHFIAAGATSPLAELLTLSGVFMAMTFAVFVVYGVLAHALREAVIASHRVQVWLRRGFAATFAGLGVKLALTDR